MGLKLHTINGNALILMKVSSIVYYFNRRVIHRTAKNMPAVATRIPKLAFYTRLPSYDSCSE